MDTPDRAGRTALSYAAMYGSTDCIYLLAGRGADVGHVDADGNTPLELAEGSGRQSAVDALKKLQLRVKMQEKRKVGVLSGNRLGEQTRDWHVLDSTLALQHTAAVVQLVAAV